MRRLLLRDNFQSDMGFASCVQRQWFVVVYVLQLLCAAFCTPCTIQAGRAATRAGMLYCNQHTYANERKAEANQNNMRWVKQ